MQQTHSKGLYESPRAWTGVYRATPLLNRTATAGGWLLLAAVLGFSAWFLGPDQHRARAIDRYYDWQSDTERYQPRQELAGHVRHYQSRELSARELEMRAAEIRYKSGAVRESASEVSISLWVASCTTLGLAGGFQEQSELSELALGE